MERPGKDKRITQNTRNHENIRKNPRESKKLRESTQQSHLYLAGLLYAVGNGSGGGSTERTEISSLSEVTDKAKEGADTILDVAKYILAAVLGIALVFVIYSLATNNPHAKEYLLGWIIAVVVIMVAFLII